MKILLDDIAKTIEQVDEDGFNTELVSFYGRYTNYSEIVKKFLTKGQFSTFIGDDGARKFTLSKKNEKILLDIIIKHKKELEEKYGNSN